MSQIQSFAPIEDANATVLILGSMPGLASLRAGEYYAHPKNIFWRIMGSLITFDLAMPYTKRVQALKTARIAVWDVLHTCAREGSLDADIDADSQIPNDFQSFFAHHSNITHVFFNGAVAEKSYHKHVFSKITVAGLTYMRLPSTSPANASIPYERKLEAWRAICNAL